MTLADSFQLTNMFMETEPTYLGEHWPAQHARFRRAEINSMYALSYIMAVPVNELTLGTTLGNLGMTDVASPNPVFPGDTLLRHTASCSDPGDA